MPKRRFPVVDLAGSGPLYPMAMSGLPFLKMHGLGNDFVVLAGRARAISIRRCASNFA